MTEVYRRRPAPPDWPRPASIITREIDLSTGLLQTPYCPREFVRSELYIPGTEPTRECDRHLAFQYDTLGAPVVPPIRMDSIRPADSVGERNH
jgi:hypothetical protein